MQFLKTNRQLVLVKGDAEGRDWQEIKLEKEAWGRSQRPPSSKARSMKTKKGDRQVLSKQWKGAL